MILFILCSILIIKPAPCSIFLYAILLYTWMLHARFYPIDKDHHPIIITVNTSDHPVPERVSKWNFKKAKWDIFQNQCIKEITPNLFHEAEDKMPILLPCLRDFWFGFDGICAFTIVMGIFVLLRVQELVIVVLWKCFCVSILFCHQIKSCFHTWTDSLGVLSWDIFWPDVIINIHLKARNILHEIWSITSSLMVWTPGSIMAARMTARWPGSPQS